MIETATDELISPRLRVLREAIACDGSSALAAFWAEIEIAGAPLIEPDPERSDCSLVTFLWRETEPVAHVALIQWFSPGDFGEKLLTHLPGSDCWYRTYRLRSDLRTVYEFGPNDSLVPKREEQDWQTRQARWCADPLNPDGLVDPPNAAAMSEDGHKRSILTLPGAEPQPWIAPREGVPAGSVTKSRIPSEILQNERDLWFYRPADREPDVLLVLFDAHRCLTAMQTPTLLDNLNASGETPALAAVMIDNVDRGAELPCNPEYLRFLCDELIPFTRSVDGLDFEPTQIIPAGQSYGGLAAAYCALERPDVFAGAISQSGSFWWKPDPRNDEQALVLGDAPDWAVLPRRAATLPHSDARFYLDAGTLENRSFDDGAPSLLASNRHMRDVLIARGFDITYREFAGGHDSVWWRSTLADGILALLADPA
jgi:enterochelin esterase family protein